MPINGFNYSFIEKNILYDGSQLRSFFCEEVSGIRGNAIISFIGPAKVKEHMVDIEDKKNREFIFSDNMLHFIIEIFDKDLLKAILLKRLFLSIISDEINKKIKVKRLIRRENGIYDGKKKLTVAVATCSPVSCLIHIGLNIVKTGTPIRVACLNDYKINPEKFSLKLMKLFADEFKSVLHSPKKVKSVK